MKNKLPKLYTLNVREVELGDAEYLLSLRLDESYNKFISKVNDDIEAQKQYITKYQNDNIKKRTSFYFIFENSETKERCGTVRIYNFKDDVFEWGSWILDKNKTRYAAIEVAILVYEFAFNSLGFNKSEFEVNKNNERVVSYHKRSGAKIIDEDDVNFYFRIEKEVGLEFTRTLRKKLDIKL